jgi:hypothetical protein
VTLRLHALSDGDEVLDSDTDAVAEGVEEADAVMDVEALGEALGALLGEGVALAHTTLGNSSGASRNTSANPKSQGTKGSGPPEVKDFEGHRERKRERLAHHRRVLLHSSHTYLIMTADAHDVRCCR